MVLAYAFPIPKVITSMAALASSIAMRAVGDTSNSVSTETHSLSSIPASELSRMCMAASWSTSSVPVILSSSNSAPVSPVYTNATSTSSSSEANTIVANNQTMPLTPETTHSSQLDCTRRSTVTVTMSSLTDNLYNPTIITSISTGSTGLVPAAAMGTASPSSGEASSISRTNASATITFDSAVGSTTLSSVTSTGFISSTLSVSLQNTTAQVSDTASASSIPTTAGWVRSDSARPVPFSSSVFGPIPTFTTLPLTTATQSLTNIPTPILPLNASPIAIAQSLSTPLLDAKGSTFLTRSGRSCSATSVMPSPPSASTSTPTLTSTSPPPPPPPLPASESAPVPTPTQSQSESPPSAPKPLIAISILNSFLNSETSMHPRPNPVSSSSSSSSSSSATTPPSPSQTVTPAAFPQVQQGQPDRESLAKTTGLIPGLSNPRGEWPNRVRSERVENKAVSARVGR